MPINSFLYPAPSTPNFGYDVANSLRFNDGSSEQLFIVTSAGSEYKATFSAWVKKTTLGVESFLLYAYYNSSNKHVLNFYQDQIYINLIVGASTAATVVTNRVFRDPSAWLHIVVAWDTTQSTASDRIKVYVNGVQETSFGTANYPDQNTNIQFNRNTNGNYVGGQAGSNTFDGYMSEVVYIDGSALDPTSFGEFDSDSPTIWKPKDVSGLTFGTNGFYLEFKQSGTSQNSSGLGADTSGNDNHLAVTNLTATDQSTDTCTNNGCTLNPLDAYYESSTFSEGNLKIVTESSGYSYNTSTIGLTTGKWYCEVYIEATPHSGTKDSMIGVAGRMSEADLGYLGLYSDTYGIYGGNGNIYNGGSGSSYGVSHTTGDIIGIYLDLDNNKLYFAKNGTLMNSGTGKDITAVSNTTAGAYFMVAADFYNGASGTYRLNFGSPIYSLSSANADANGQGSFEYNPSSGTFDGASKDFLAINTKNLAEFG
jgi:hypothetical protein